MAEASGVEPTNDIAKMPFAGFEDHQRSSDPFGKFPTITDLSTAYQAHLLTRSDPISAVLNVELARFITAKFVRWHPAQS
jgi:hypothetical protein